jgi:hypothetical protein
MPTAAVPLPQVLISLYAAGIVSVKEPTSGEKNGVVAGLLVGASGMIWILSQHEPDDMLGRLGMACALFCLSAVFAASWAAIVAHVAHKRDWSPRSCNLAGMLSLLAVGSLGLFLGNTPSRSAPFFLIMLAWFGGYLTRKLAYPELTEEEANAPPPPLSLFPK